MDEKVMKALREPFDESLVEIKPQVVDRDNGTALAVSYVDARAVAERLDSATGGDWEFRAEVVVSATDHVVIKGTLTVCGVTREDFGEYTADNRSDMEMYKAAVSDALKRAAVQFGVGRDLYALKPRWLPYDSKTKKFVEGGRKAERQSKPEDTKTGGPYDDLIAKLNAAFGASKTRDEVFTEIHGAKANEGETKTAILLWYFTRGMEVFSGGKEYESADVLAYIKAKVTDDSVASLPDRVAALKQYFKEK